MNKYKCAICGKDFGKQEDRKDFILLCQECFNALRMRKVPKNTEVIGKDDSHVTRTAP